MVQNPPADQQLELGWLLRDKYGWSNARIHALVATMDIEDLAKLEQGRVVKDLSRLAAGEPLAYVIGWVKFLGCKIKLDRKVLIPRPETEFWLEQFLATRPSKGGGSLQVLDLCCGSGCIGIAVLSRWPEAEVTFVDVSTDAVEQTRANLIENGLRQETKVIQADLADFLASGQTPQFNLILTNPPYVDPTGEFEESLKWEPAQALFAQDRGLSLIYQILELAPKKLKVGGELVIEFGKGQEKAIEQKLRELDLAHYTFGKDQFGVVRWVRLKWKQ